MLSSKSAGNGYETMLQRNNEHFVPTDIHHRDQNLTQIKKKNKFGSGFALLTPKRLTMQVINSNN